jgi:nucleoside-diphosphate-sugar epimerase
MKCNKVIVTGGAGFIGSHLARTLRNKGYAVRVFDIAVPPRPTPGIEYINGDIRDSSALEREFDGATFVFHLAALPRVPYSLAYPRESNETNVSGTLNVLLAARRAGVRRVIYSASSSAYGDQPEMPLTETMLPQPKSPYGLQKYVGEQYARIFAEAYGLQTVSLRYFNVYGPGADPNGPYAQVIPKFIVQRLNGEPMTINGDGTQTRDLVHVRDVARANLLAAESSKVGSGEVLNIGAGRNISINRIAELIGGATRHVEPRLEPHDTLASIGRAVELLGWQPKTSIEEGILELKQLAGLE